ncbi:MAG TPA: NAD+ synthase [Gemmatimonadaceae bacterium]|jgi:NAD+ synthetase|nr:NAD+ synthase [Gemmatimonadaceae bacterium]
MSRTVHLAIAQFRPRKGDVQGNLARVGALFAQLIGQAPRPDVLCLPESALTGYFLEGGVREHAMTTGALALALQETYARFAPGAEPLDVVLGFYELWNGKLYNSAAYVTLGGAAPVVRHVHRKLFLPTYGLFDEERFVERGRDMRAFDTPWGRAAILICEDAWHSLTSTVAALDGAQVLFIPSAPPARGPWSDTGTQGMPSSVSRWERLTRDMAEEHGAFVVLATLAGSEGGRMFPGASMVAGPKGEVRVRGPLWHEALVVHTLDFADVARARADQPLLADLEVMAPHLRGAMERVERHQPAVLAYDPAPAARQPEAARERPASTSGATPLEVVNGDAADRPPVPLEIDPALTADWLAAFLRDELAQRGYKKAVVGISGGVDSAVTAFLAARAIGAANVIGVRMPYRTSSPQSSADGQCVIEALGIEGRTVDISAAVDGYLSTTTDADATRCGNVMARVRMITLFDLSARDHALPLGTGNKTERMLGYFTWHADDTPPVNPLGDLFKTQVWELARYLGVPDSIVRKPPTADLVAGQTDEGDLGISYASVDRILNWLLAGYTATDLIERGFDADEVALVHRRVGQTHWKRKLPTVAMLSPTAIGESYLRPVDY